MLHDERLFHRSGIRQPSSHGFSAKTRARHSLPVASRNGLNLVRLEAPWHSMELGLRSPERSSAVS